MKVIQGDTVVEVCDRCGKPLVGAKTDTPNPEWNGSWGYLCDNCVRGVFAGREVTAMATRYELRDGSWVKGEVQWNRCHC